MSLSATIQRKYIEIGFSYLLTVIWQAAWIKFSSEAEANYVNRFSNWNENWF